MERSQKETIVGEIKGKLGKIQSIVLADFRGITVPTVTRVRDDFRKEGCEYHVLKNTLVELAIKGTRIEPIAPLLKGPTAMIWSYEDPAIAAKVATKWAKDSDKFVIKGGWVNGTMLDKKGVEFLASMPGKDELRATLLATFLSGPQSFVALLAAAPQNFVYLLDAKTRASGEQNQAA